MLDKTVSNVSYRGGQEQSVFPIPFPFLENSHIRAWVKHNGGGAATLVAGRDYAINSVSEANGEFILLGEPLPEGAVLTISRLVPLTQEIFFHNQGPNSPRATEEAADKLTMIAQQLQAGIDNCIPAPEGESPEEIAEAIAGYGAAIEAVRAELRTVDAKADTKAARDHGHTVSEIAELEDRLTEKADAMAVAAALAGKADSGLLQAKADAAHNHNQCDVDGLEAALAAKAGADQVNAKADRQHVHPQSEISDLATALAAKLDADDPRLVDIGLVVSHAARHAVSGDDPIHPADIGVLPAPPGDGKTYLAAGGGWVEYVPPSGGGSGGEQGGTLDHSQLINRDGADQHPQSAIQRLPADLEDIRSAIDKLDKSLVVKADREELPAAASQIDDGLMSAADKRKLDAIPEGGLPADGRAGDFLAIGQNGAAQWQDSASSAGLLPLMSSSQKGVARLTDNAGLELDEDGSLRIKEDSLVSKADLDTRIASLNDRVAVAEQSVTEVEKVFGGLGSMAVADDAPANGKPHLRKDGAWVEYSGGGTEGGGVSAIVGEIRLLPFRRDELPDGWYFANGDRFPLSSDQGRALAGLSENMRSDWGIVAANDAISLPNLVAADGYFLRPVDNSARLPGSVQQDAIRNITGTFSVASSGGIAWASSSNGTSSASGAFVVGKGTKPKSFVLETHQVDAIGDLEFDASGSVPTAAENRPVNIGMTPAVYLGV